jgi:predicted small secreted protein
MIPQMMIILPDRETPSMKPSRIVPLVAILCAFSLAACANTVRGVGKDVKSTAHAIQETVE